MMQYFRDFKTNTMTNFRLTDIFSNNSFPVITLAIILIFNSIQPSTANFSFACKDTLPSNDSMRIQSGYINFQFCYQAFQMIPSKNGTYSFTIESTMHINVYISLKQSDPFSLLKNSMKFGRKDIKCLHLENPLYVGYEYVLVISIDKNGKKGNFSVTIRGPADLQLTTNKPLSNSLSCTKFITLKNKNKADESKRMETIIISLVTVVIIIFIVCICIYRYKRRKHALDRHRYSQEISDLSVQQLSVRDNHRNETTNNEVGVLHTISIIEISNPAEEQPPPSYNSVV
ncbi:hypothetical protein I4U23_015561 [Adineta vaga]|nr:hypothetical protein I4U23_015561 [Adineta vaga]